jgi:hypothetical protein
MLKFDASLIYSFYEDTKFVIPFKIQRYRKID